MNDQSSASRVPGSRDFDLTAGDRVQICTGKLAGLTGTVASLRDQAKCLLKIDAWPDGAYVVVHREVLEPI